MFAKRQKVEKMHKYRVLKDLGDQLKNIEVFEKNSLTQNKVE